MSNKTNVLKLIMLKLFYTKHTHEMYDFTEFLFSPDNIISNNP